MSRWYLDTSAALVALPGGRSLPDPDLRSFDSLHLAAALRIGTDRVVTHDLRLADAARGLGLRVLSPT